MASGVKVSDAVKDLIAEMKILKCDPQCVRIATFKIGEDSIVVDKVIRQADLGTSNGFLAFKELLDPAKCRYILYDCHFDTTESSNKKELVFVLWCPESSQVKEKMRFASSKDALKKCMTGVKHQLQMNELADCGDKNCFAGQLGKDVICLEGDNV